MRKIQSCVNMNAENLQWLKKQELGISRTINDVVKVLRENSELLVTVRSRMVKEGEEEPSEMVLAAKELLFKEQQDREIKIRAHFQDFPHIVYMAKTQRKFNKADICKIKDDLFYGKYNVVAEVTEIRKLLKEEMDKFDVKAYEVSRGILPKV